MRHGACGPTPTPRDACGTRLYERDERASPGNHFGGAPSSDGVVRIETTACNGGGVGSGFLLAPDLVATVAHVVDGAVSIVIRQNGITTTGTVIGSDTHADLALVRTHPPLSGHLFVLDTSQPEVGTDVGANDGAAVEFTSVQDPTAGGHGQACSNWQMDYTLVSSGPGWLIDTARPRRGSPASC